MKNANIKELFQKAEEELYRAREELYHPAEDVSNYSVCVFARRALHRYLLSLYMLYASENKESINENQTLEQLIEYCGNHNEKLNELDFSQVYCTDKDMIHDDDEDVYYCNNVFKVKYCAKLATDVRDLVLEKAGSSIQSTP